MSEASDGSGLLVSGRFLRRYGDELERAEAEAGLRLERIALSDDPEARLASADCERVALAFFSPDVFPGLSRPFVSAVYRSPNLRWLQVFNAGVDHDFFQTVMQRGVRLSTAAGTSAEPIALTAIAALLFLARGFPHWIDAQRRRAWETLPSEQVPHDLLGQTLRWGARWLPCSAWRDWSPASVLRSTRDGEACGAWALHSSCSPPDQSRVAKGGQGEIATGCLKVF